MVPYGCIPGEATYGEQKTTTRLNRFCSGCNWKKITYKNINIENMETPITYSGVVAHMVERSLCMREVQGSIPCSSSAFAFWLTVCLTLRCFADSMSHVAACMPYGHTCSKRWSERLERNRFSSVAKAWLTFCLLTLHAMYCMAAQPQQYH